VARCDAGEGDLGAKLMQLNHAKRWP
jgi:hypothetical protein